MTPKRRKRLFAVGALLIGVIAAAALALMSFQQNMMYFYSPTDVRSGAVPADAAIRLGGLVVEGSLKKSGDSLKVNFDVTDKAETVAVTYSGILPDLFREGQGIIATGRMDANGVFIASEVLAKHDENYMPPEVHEALKKAEGKTSNVTPASRP